MIKRYEWTMALADGMALSDGMDELSRDGWEFVSGPAWDPKWLQFACLMRREVVPGGVQREEVQGFQPRPPVLRNCWTCKHASAETEGCAVHMFSVEVRGWIADTHKCGASECPPEADGCPAWAAKEVTP